MTQKEAPEGTGATLQVQNVPTPSVAGTALPVFAGAWAFSPIRMAGVEAEQRALENFEHIADVMPEVAQRLTAALLPDETDAS